VALAGDRRVLDGRRGWVVGIKVFQLVHFAIAECSLSSFKVQVRLA